MNTKQMKIRIEFASPSIKAIDHLSDIQEAVVYASKNLLRNEIRMSNVYTKDDKVFVNLLVPEERYPKFRIGRRLRGISVFLLKQNPQYQKYKVGTRVLFFLDVSKEIDDAPKTQTATNAFEYDISNAYEEIPYRLKTIAEMRESGATCAEIGKHFNISDSRVSQLYKKYKRIVNYNKAVETHASDTDDIFNYLWKAQKEIQCERVLVTRTYACLFRGGLLANNDILMNQHSDDELLKLSNFGIKSLALVRTALEIHKKEVENVCG